MKRFLSGFQGAKWCLSCDQFIKPGLLSQVPSLCAPCHQKLPWFRQELCFFCGHHHLQGECNSPLSFHIDEYRAVFYYQEPLNQWVAGLKYSRNLLKGRTLKALLTQWFQDNQTWLGSFDVLLPVPLHQSRLWNRGFNQTQYLVRDQKVIPVHDQLVSKIRRTQHQAALSGKHRFSNLKRSFKASSAVEGLNLLLFDDVCTTGQTLDQIASCLKKAGAASVSALTLARTQPGRPGT